MEVVALALRGAVGVAALEPQRNAGRVLAAVPFDQLGRLVPQLGESGEPVAANDPPAGQAGLQPRACGVRAVQGGHVTRLRGGAQAHADHGHRPDAMRTIVGSA